jgi:VanZ family protein
MTLAVSTSECVPDCSGDRRIRIAERAFWIVAAVGLSLAFVDLSVVPLIFSDRDLSGRLWRMLTFADLPQGGLLIRDLALNILAMVPIGFAWAAVFQNAGRHPSFAVRKSIGTCFGIALLAEIIQLWLPMRYPSLRDVAALTTGAAIGCGIHRWAGQGVSRLVQASCRILIRGSGPGARLAQIAVIVLAAFAASTCVRIARDPRGVFVLTGARFDQLRHPRRLDHRYADVFHTEGRLRCLPNPRSRSAWAASAIGIALLFATAKRTRQSQA